VQCVPQNLVTCLSIFLLSAKDYAGNERVVTSEEFIVDSSPPVNGFISLGDISKETNFIHSSSLSLHLQQFYDHHSGIGHFKIGVGSRSEIADVLQFSKYETNHIDITIDHAGIMDGHTYFVIVQVLFGFFTFYILQRYDMLVKLKKIT